MKTLRTLLYGFVLVGLSTCVDPYEFEFQKDTEENFVIDGYLSNEHRVHQIRVSRTTHIGDFNGVVADYVTNATVVVIDDQGAEISFEHDDAGVYKSLGPVQALPDRAYKVRVTLINGTVYESNFQTLPEAAPMESELKYELGYQDVLVNNTIQEEQGVKVSAVVEKGAENQFYRWEMNHYFIIESDAGPGFRNPQEQRGLTDTELRFCFIKDFPPQELYLLENISNTPGDTYETEIEFIPISNKFEYVFVVEGRQLVMAEDAYRYWEDIQTLAENAGGLFDSAPFPVIGNITRVTDNPDGTVVGLGYFGVYNASVDRKFMTQASLGIDEEFAPCTVPPSPGGEPRPHQCQDCRLYEFPENYENSPPSWWGY